MKEGNSMAKRKTWWERDGKEILKRGYKTLYQVLLGTLLAVLPYLSDIVLESQYGKVLEANPALIAVFTYAISLIDNTIRARSKNLTL